MKNILIIILFFTLSAHAQNYKKQWAGVMELESNGEFKKAATAADAIYTRAKKDRNEPQLLKAFFFKSKYMQMLEEDAQLSIINNLQAEIKTATPATKALMESLYAQMLTAIYNRNSYQIRIRTDVVGTTPTNYAEWGAKNFTDAITAAYERSIANRELLYKTPLSTYDAVIEFAPVLAKTNRSLYDFLVASYLDYEQASPTHVHTVNRTADLPYLFGDETAFQNLAVTDSVMGRGRGFTLLRQTEAFYMQKNDHYALQLAVVRRLEYANREIYLPAKNDFLLPTLAQLATRWGNSPFAYRAMYKEAEIYKALAHKTTHPDYFVRSLSIIEHLLAVKDRHDVAHEAELLKADIVSQSSSIVTERFIMPGQPSLAAINFKNLDSVRVSIYKITQPKQKERYSTYRNTDTFNDSLIKQKPLLQKSYTLPNKGYHFSYDTEIILPPLDKGYYAVVVSAGGNDSISKGSYAVAEFQASQLSYSMQTVNGGTHYQFTDRASGAPVKSVAGTFNGIAYTSGADGKIVIPYNKENISGTAIFIHKGDTLSNYLNTYSYRYNTSDDDEADASAQVYFDRAIYRPGQTVFFKGIVTSQLRDLYTVVPNVYFNVTAEDASGNEIKKFRLKTNEFGSFIGEFELPKNGMTGEYNLYVAEDGDYEDDPAYDKKKDEHPFYDFTQFHSADFHFLVEDYKRPTFEVTFKPVTKALTLNDSITVTGMAKSFSGAPLTGAEVDYRVRRVQYYRYGGNSYYDDDNYYNHDSDENGDLLEDDLTETDAQGNFKIPFVLEPPDEKPGTRGVYRYIVYADVTDVNGETHTQKFELKAGSQSMYAEVTVPAAIDAKKGAELTLTTTNLNNRALAADGEVKIYKVITGNRLVGARPWPAPELQTIPEAEFIKNFPHIPYGNEADTLTVPKPYFVQQVNTGRQKTVLLKDFKGWPSGKYSVVFTAKDSLGRQEKHTTQFALERKSDDLLPDNQLFTFKQINTDAVKDGYVQVEVRTALPVLYGNLLANANNITIYNQALVVKNGRTVVKVPVIKHPETTMPLRFDFIWQNQLFSNEINVRIDKAPEPFTIEMESTNSRLAPGGEQSWSFTIKNGKKIEAELLAGMYDASLDQFAKEDWRDLDTYRYRYDNVPYKDLQTRGKNYDTFKTRPVFKTTSVLWGDSFYMYGFDIIKANNQYVQYRQKTQVSAVGDVTITGIVTDEEDMPLHGVYVSITGTAEGTQTDFDGRYTIYVANGEQISFQYSGAELQTVLPPAGGKLNIKLKIEELDEVVVSAYSSIKGPVSNNAVTTVTSKTIEGRPNASYIQTLQGQVPGLNISTDTVTVGYGTSMYDNYWALGGEGGSVKIRGAATIDGKANPLIIIDGVPVGQEEFKTIKQSDILSISVLKESAELAPYGERGKNGVLLITTRQGMESLTQVETRKNFNETAFFFPQLKTDRKGNITFSFTTPEALTQWKLRLFAHNKKGVDGYLEKMFFTQKDLMIVPNMPRFLRETDTITISAKITNMTAEAKTGTALLQLFDAVSMQPVDAQMLNTNNAKPFTLNANGNTNVGWIIAIPTGLQGVQYKVLAKAGTYTDGEENMLPVLTNSMLVTESIPLWVRENATKTYTLQNLKNNTSTTLRHQGITLEYTSNPAWVALKALPYLMEYEHECAEQVFSRFYGNSIGTHIINSNTKIAGVFESWRKAGITPKLEQNEELKSIILAETPWVLDNQSEEEQNNRLALLFDLDKMKQSLDANFKKLQDMQDTSGGFAWFKGGTNNDYITRHIVAGFGHLSKLGILSKADSIKVAGIINKAVPYIDGGFYKHDREAKKYRKKNEPFKILYVFDELHYLYTRSFYLKQFPMGDSLAVAIEPYIAYTKHNWTDYSLYQKAMAALVMHRYGEAATAQKILTYLKESSSNNEDWGMYWIDNKPGWWWFQAPVETQALLIEAFAEVNNDTKSVDAMKVWLLKQKQNKNWPTTKATTEAVYALLMQGTDWLSVQGATTFKMGDEKLMAKKLSETAEQAGTGYVKLQWQPEEITKDMATLTVTNNSAVPGYGGLYWQYFENLDKIQPAQDGIMNIKKELYLKNNASEDTELVSVTEKSPLKVGDLVTVRLVLTIKEDVEYVHLKDMRASAFEPVEVLSGYHYKDKLGYYQSTRDAATHFFFDRISRGTYVLEYDVRVNNAGEFSNGITTIQSMYAPEFSGHTQGVRVKAE
jgi:hypothetical protein